MISVSVTYDGLDAGTYDLFVRWGTGNCAVNLPDATLEEIAEPILSLGDDRLICTGESVTITANITDGTEPFTYLWSTGATGPFITETPGANGVYGLTITDASGCQSEDDVSVTVSEFPVASDDEGSACPETESLTIDLFANDSNTGALTAINIIDAPNHGTVGIGSDGTAVYSPEFGFCGSDDFTYEICINDCCSEATVSIEYTDDEDPEINASFSSSHGGLR